MKKLIILSILGLFTWPILAQQFEKTVKAQVKKAVIYLQGAQLYSSEMVTLQAGRTDIIFEGVSPVLQENNIQASGKGNFVITETRFLRKYKENVVVKIDNKYNKMIEMIQDSIEDIEYMLQDTRNRQTTLETEKKMLLGNRIMTGQTQKDSLELLKQGMNFLRERLNNIYAEELKITREEKKLNKTKTAMEVRKNDYILLQQGKLNSTSQAEPVNLIIVTVFSESAVNANITISYFVQNAGWVPYYEIHGAPTEGNVKLKQMASVFQMSQVDWKDASIILSTATPNGFSMKPELNNWYVGFFTQQYKSISTYGNAPKLKSIQKQTDNINESPRSDEEDKAVAKDMSDFVAITQNMILTEYELKIKYNIPSDNQMHYVSIQNKELNASYYYSVVPKLDKKAYLMTRVTGWEDLNLIPGKAKIYYDGNLAGNTEINPDETNDTLTLNMGRDNSIVIQKKKLKEECSDRIMHDEHVKKIYYEIVVRNTKNLPINITIEDQIPLVQPGINNIKIELKESSGANYSDITGKLTWNTKIGVKDSKKIIFGFQITSPKDIALSGL